MQVNSLAPVLLLSAFQPALDQPLRLTQARSLCPRAEPQPSDLSVLWSKQPCLLRRDFVFGLLDFRLIWISRRGYSRWIGGRLALNRGSVNEILAVNALQLLPDVEVRAHLSSALHQVKEGLS